MKTLNDFLFEYDSGDLKFNSLQYRKGAKITAPFGITEGFQIIDEKVVFGKIPRIHSGVDRSYHNKAGLNIILSPFTFNRSEFHDYGNDNEYGSVIRLFNDDYEFEMRIMHVSPETIESSVLNILNNKGAIKYNTIIGEAGEYGLFSGKHTHTEIVSLSENSQVLDDLLELKYREDAFLPYTKEHILFTYRTFDYWKDERRDSLILSDFEKQKTKRHIKDNLLNDYSYTYKDWYSGWEYRTRYSSEKLFNGL